MLLTLRLPLPSSEPAPRHAFVTFDGNRIVDLRIARSASPALEALAPRLPAAPIVARYRNGRETAPGAGELYALAAAVNAIARLIPGDSESLHAAGEDDSRVWALVRRTPGASGVAVRV